MSAAAPPPPPGGGPNDNHDPSKPRCSTTGSSSSSSSSGGSLRRAKTSSSWIDNPDEHDGPSSERWRREPLLDITNVVLTRSARRRAVEQVSVQLWGEDLSLGFVSTSNATRARLHTTTRCTFVFDSVRGCTLSNHDVRTHVTLDRLSRHRSTLSSSRVLRA